jgi:hypothetical protein
MSDDDPDRFTSAVIALLRLSPCRHGGGRIRMEDKQFNIADRPV